MDRQTELFRKLKPHCIALAQCASTIQKGHGKQKELIAHLEALKNNLASVNASSGCTLDSKLADYVFFPLAQLLKESQRLSIRFFELCLQSVAILIEKGWRQRIPPQLATQLVILCTRLGERQPKGFSFSETTDELQASSFWCQYHIFTEGGKHGEIKELLNSESNFLHLAQTMTNLLEGVEACVNDGPQIAGASALVSLVKNILDIECQASFLPGFVSKLTKILTPVASRRRNPKVLVMCLDIMRVLLGNTMNDSLTVSPEDTIVPQGKQKMGITKKWREVAVSELKPAIDNILRLKSHARQDVKAGVTDLCIHLLRDCRKTLANCVESALEALVSIVPDIEDKQHQAKLQALVKSDGSIVAMLQTMLYDWLRSIPTVMQSPDDEVKTARINQIAVIYKLLLGTELDMTTISRLMATELRDGAILTFGSGRHSEPSGGLAPLRAIDLTVLGRDQNGLFPSQARLMKNSGQSRDLEKLADIARLVGTSNLSLDFSTELMRNLRQSSGQTQLANFWLLLNTVEATVKQRKDIDDFLDLGPDSNIVSDQLEEIYAFALSTLTEAFDEQQDPRLLALALQGLSLRAQTAGVEFKGELVDALYPVLHTLATPNDDLQRESVNTLDTFTAACGYNSTKDLVVDNVDYLTNAVALKLNAFDVSPQAPQVLLMMVRLAGPSLIPYLQDTIESIFAALGDYHGYPLLVELLFKVLGAMAEEGVKAPQLSITDGKSTTIRSHDLEMWKPTTVSGLTFLLKEHDLAQKPKVAPQGNREPHPKQPWKETGIAEQDDDIDAEQLLDKPDPPPPAAKTYDLLFKITELTQHYLPSASPSLRTSLLSLIRTTVPAIAHHENSFLPLINTLWPEIVSRLDDEEPYTVASAIEVVGILCEYAGDFMRSRISQLWPRLLDFRRHAAPRTRGKRYNNDLKGTASNRLEDTLTMRGNDNNKHISPPVVAYNAASANHLPWQALVPAMTKIVSFVEISPEMFDDALHILQPVIQETEVQQALRDSNADALWLAQVQMGTVPVPDMPSQPDGHRWRFAAVVT